MKFPSTEYDGAVAQLCNGSIEDEQMDELVGLLNADGSALDEYLLRVEVHARLTTMQIADPQMAPAPRTAPRATREPYSGPKIAAWSAAVLVVGIVSYLVGSGFFLPERTIENLTPSEPLIVESTTTDNTTLPSTTTDNTTLPPDERIEPDGLMFMAGITPANVQFVFTSDAPVIVGSGLKEPLPLGAYVPYQKGGNLLHVWDWSKSNTSRVFQNIQFNQNHRYAVSPDGKRLVSSRGEIIDLETGEMEEIDLGDETYRHAEGSLPRMRGLAFTPDGGRLAMLVTNIETGPATHPLNRSAVTFTDEMLILEFPSCRLASRIPAGFHGNFRMGFSSDGKQAFAPTPPNELAQKIIEYKTETGEVVREYEPAIQEHAYALAVSPNGRKLAVFDGIGALLIWDAVTGELLHRVESVRHESNSTVLRFSPDSKFIAVNAVTKTFIVDAEAGTLVQLEKGGNAAQFHWSEDGTRLTIVTGHSYYGGRMLPTYNHFPAVYEWEWRANKLLKSHSAPPPTAE